MELRLVDVETYRMVGVKHSYGKKAGEVVPHRERLDYRQNVLQYRENSDCEWQEVEHHGTDEVGIND